MEFRLPSVPKWDLTRKSILSLQGKKFGSNTMQWKRIIQAKPNRLFSVRWLQYILSEIYLAPTLYAEPPALLRHPKSRTNFFQTATHTLTLSQRWDTSGDISGQKERIGWVGVLAYVNAWVADYLVFANYHFQKRLWSRKNYVLKDATSSDCGLFIRCWAVTRSPSPKYVLMTMNLE